MKRSLRKWVIPDTRFAAIMATTGRLIIKSALGRLKCGSKCNCWLCKRGRKFYRITGKLERHERDWMRAVYDALLDCESILECQRQQ